MVQSIQSKPSDVNFSLNKMFPRHVQNSRGDIKPFNPDKMVQSLNKETGLDWEESINVVKDSLKRITVLGLKEIQTSMIREIMCLDLLARGHDKERNIYAKLINSSVIKFEIDPAYIDTYRGRQPDWGPLGYITYKRTYARLIEAENRTEEFFETVRRVVEGAYSIQKEHCYKLGLPWDPAKAQRSAQRMFEKIWTFRFLPPGRGLWMMGTEFIDKHGSMALNNCGFVSTEDIVIKKTKAFEWLMDALMLGVGVGFDTKGAGKLTVQKPKDETFVFEVPDSREGWVQALRHLLRAYFEGEAMPIYDFSKVRPAGSLIRGFGGVASGPEPLNEMLNSQKEILDSRIGKALSSVDILDMMNLIGKCVVAGNVRRSAEIALGDLDDNAYISCKQDEKALYHHRWASNNSIIGYRGMDYSKILDSIAKNGEPGIIYLDNARAYSRMGHAPDYKDKKAVGVNPCVTGDTLIAVADGRNAVPIKELAIDDKDVPVYCKDNEGTTVIRMMRNPRITGYDQEIYEITLDDGSSITCTGNHKFYMRDMTQKEAKALQMGDSLIITSKWQTSWSEIMDEDKERPNQYWMVNDGKHNVFEHKLIYEELSGDLLKKGEIIHHRDKNSLNNNFANLEKMSKEDHDALHDISGDKNPMRKWWNNVSLEERQSYKKKMSQAISGEKNGNYSGFSDEDILNEMTSYIQKYGLPLTFPAWKKHSRRVGMPHTSPRWGPTQTPIYLIKQANALCGFRYYENSAVMREYKRFIKRQKTSDLDLIFQKCTFVVKTCEHCGNRFQVKWGKREQAYCSYQCSNIQASQKAMKSVKVRTQLAHEKKLTQAFNLFDQFIQEKYRVPEKSEFIGLLNQKGIKDLRTMGLPDSYQHFLNMIADRYVVEPISSRKLVNSAYNHEIVSRLLENGLVYNHKVVSIRKLGRATVYNGTVDEFHNYGIVLNESQTKSNKPKLSMVFTANCGEQTLESFELCCLVETFPSRHESYEEFEETLKYAYLYAKSVTLVNTHWNETNAVMGKNRRIGTSQTGIIDAFARHGRKTVLDWSERGYKYLRQQDEDYSDFFCVPQSIKITTVKPSGTVSLLPGVAPGIHYPHSEYYIRRIRISKESTLIDLLREANFHIEQDAYSDNSMVVEFPIHEKNFLRAKKDVSIWEQLANAVDYQHYWSDNQVSITATFKKEEVKDLKYALQFIEDKLKGLSLLPLTDSGYKQMPYEEITKEEFERQSADLKPIKTWITHEKSVGTVYCDGDSCHQVEEANVLREMEAQLHERIPAIKDISSDSFGFNVENGTIIEVGLFNKKIDDLPENFSHLVNLRRLSLKNCGLEHLPGGLIHFSNLEFLDISGNPLSKIPDDVKGWITGLKAAGKTVIQ